MAFAAALTLGVGLLALTVIAPERAPWMGGGDRDDGPAGLAAPGQDSAARSDLARGEAEERGGEGALSGAAESPARDESAGPRGEAVGAVTPESESRANGAESGARGEEAAAGGGDEGAGGGDEGAGGDRAAAADDERARDDAGADADDGAAGRASGPPDQGGRGERGEPSGESGSSAPGGGRSPGEPEPQPAEEPGFVTLDADPYATIVFGGENLGNTPLVRREVPPGRHRVEVRFSTGDVDVTTVEVEPGEDYRQRFQP